MKTKVSVLNEVRRCKLMLSFALTCAVGGMFSVARGEGPSQINVSDYLPGAGSCVLDSVEELRVKVNRAKASGEVVLAAATSADDVSIALNRGAVFLTGGQVSGSQFSGITATESTARGEDMTEAFPFRWLKEGPYFAYMGTGIPQVEGGLLKVNRDKIRAIGGATVDLVMLGDSISHYWPVNGPVSWAAFNEGRRVFDFGEGSDRVQDTIYVAKWGYLDGYVAKNVSIMVGVNNLRDNASAAAIAGGIETLIGVVRAKQPNARILLHAVLPYDAAGSAARGKVAALNALLQPLADGERIVWIDMTSQFVNDDGTFKSGVIKSDSIHPAEAGYAIWSGVLQEYVELTSTDSTDVYRATPDAAGGGDGQRWDSPMTFAEAFSAAAATGGEVWLKEGVYDIAETKSYSMVTHVTVRGGFAGTETSADGRVAGKISTLDGGKAYDPLTISNEIGVELERVRLANGLNRGLKKTGPGDLSLVDCEIVDCGWTTSGIVAGHGLSVAGNGATVTLTNCLIAGCVDRANKFDLARQGGAMDIQSGLKRVILDDCRFLTNGVPFAATIRDPREWRGAAIWADSPVTLRGCEFRGNNGFSGGEGCAIVRLESGSANSAFTNCLWVGNRDQRGWTYIDFQKRGCLYVCESAAADCVDVVNCTFAYNLCASDKAAAGINVDRGTVRVRNCIFYGNAVHSGYELKTIDMYAHSANATLDVAYTLAYDLYPGEQNRTGDPLFVSPAEDFLALIDTTSPTWPKLNLDTRTAFHFKAAKHAEVLALDVHPLSKAGYFKNDGQRYSDATTMSPAVDSGDSTMDCSREEPPNGGIVNIGAYGNTKEAALSPVGQPTLSADGIAVEWVGGWSQPKITVTLGISSGDDYAATVKLFIGKNGTDWIESNEFGGVHPGVPVEWTSKNFFDPKTDRLYIKVEVSSPGAEPVLVDDEREVEAELPPWAGKGGDPAKVVHYRASATGANDGSSWQDAYADLGAALAALTSTRNELWVAGSNVLSKATAAFSPSFETTIRGGFDATENTLAERKAGAISVIDGNYSYAPFTVANTAKMTIERVKFRAAASTLVNKTSSKGDLVFDGCIFGEQQRPAPAQVNSRGVCLVGASGAKAAFTNCLFYKVQVIQQLWNNPNPGIGLYAESMGRVTLDGCDFICCGRPPAGGVELTANDVYGGAIGANGSPVTARGCRFIGCSLTDSNFKGGIVALNGNCGGSAFTNCAWIANDSFFGQTYERSYNSGALVVRCDTVARAVDLQNCTFACNISGGAETPVDLHVVKGAVTVRNSIFCGEFTNVYNTVSKAAYLREGTLNISYSLFESAADIGVKAGATGATLVTNDLIFAAAGLVYDTTAFPSVLATVRGDKRLPSNFETAVLPSLNIHLRGGTGYIDETTEEKVTTWAKRKWASPAIDAGDPTSDWTNETAPNGRRVNMGFYGNTPWETMSKFGFVLLVK